MGWFALAATVIAGVVSGVQQRNAGIIQSNQMKLQAKREGDAARGREIERKKTLMRVLSQQSARAAAAGAGFNGSLAAIAKADIEDSRNDLLTDRANTQSKILELRSGAREAKNQGYLAAGASLFDTAGDVAKTWPGKAKKP